MNREIKFRMWDKSNGKFIKNEGSLCLIPDLGLIHGSIKHPDHECYYNPNIVLQQYTGLKDKNDKEIYEGDIVFDRVSCNCLDKTMGIFIVGYDETYSAFILKSKGSDSWNWIRNVSTYGEVIGNIFEPIKD